MSKRKSMTGYVETVIQMSLFPRPTVSGDELMSDIVRLMALARLVFRRQPLVRAEFVRPPVAARRIAA